MLVTLYLFGHVYPQTPHRLKTANRVDPLKVFKARRVRTNIDFDHDVYEGGQCDRLGDVVFNNEIMIGRLRLIVPFRIGTTWRKM